METTRSVISKVLTREFTKLIETGCNFTYEELSRDIQRILGGSYCDFISK